MNINGIEIKDEIYEGMIQETIRKIIDGEKVLSDQEKSDTIKRIKNSYMNEVYDLMKTVTRFGKIDSILFEEAAASFRAAVYPIAKQYVDELL